MVSTKPGAISVGVSRGTARAVISQPPPAPASASRLVRGPLRFRIRFRVAAGCSVFAIGVTFFLIVVFLGFG